MDRSELIIAIALCLFAAFLLGWLAHALIHRISRVPASEMDEVDRLSRALVAADLARDQAIADLAQREDELTDRLSRTAAELRESRDEIASLHDYLDRLSASTGGTGPAR